MLLSVLQGSTFEGLCKLIIAVTYADIGLVGMLPGPAFAGMVPVLATPNRWYQVPIASPFFIGFMPDEDLEVECRAGTVVLAGLQGGET
jgi:hypothetical protein